MMVIAIRQFLLLAISSEVQIIVPTPKAQEQAKVLEKKIALPFVYVPHLPQYCTRDRFDVHGKSCLLICTTNLNFCPFY
jgi:hypothetical protein